MKKKVLVTRKLLRSNEERASKLWDAKLNLNDEVYSQQKIIELSHGCDGILSSLTEKIDDLHKIAKALLTYETLTGEEIENLINKNIYPASKEDLNKDDDNKDSALGSIGLKPKIVH